MTKKDIYIMGAADVFELVESSLEPKTYRVGGYFSLEEADRSMHAHYTYLGKDPLADGPDLDKGAYVIALYNNARRREIQEALIGRGRTVISICHPSAVVYPSATIGRGSIVGANAIVSTLARLHEGVYINYGSLVGHDVVVGRYSFISPGVQLLGNVMVGENALIGAGALVLPGVTIGDNVQVSAGTVIPRDVPDNTKVLSQQKVRFLPNEG